MLRNLSVTTNPKFKIDKKNIHTVVSNLKKELSFSINSLIINFISAEDIIPINVKYLGHNFSTDIITFNYSGENYTLDGEIFISLEDACINAKNFNVSLDEEILRLVIHGFLHLLGFDDKQKKDKIIMKEQEDLLVNKLQKLLLKFIVQYDC
ncbi:MAG: rRNA maturation RNase YbeY [Ignavibacteriae bacterium]|nr:rRNA maturation RNase YbeY [Ignavibacteriota bacterium]